MSVVVQLLVVLVAARVLGWLAERARQPASFGEILAGVLLALAPVAWPAAPEALSGLRESRAIDLVGEVGVFFLMLLAGVEMRPAELVEHSRESLLVALGGVALPFVTGFALAWWLLPDSGFRPAQAMIVGTGLAVTAVPIAAEILREYDLLHRPVGEVVIGAAVLDDVIGLALLALLTGLIASGDFPGAAELGLLAAKVATFFAVTVVSARTLVRWILRRLAPITGPTGELTALLAVALVYGLIALALDMHIVLGAFMAGLFFVPEVVGAQTYARIQRLIAAVTLGLVGPVFFASIGLRLDPGAVVAVPGFVAMLLAVAFLGKIVGAGVPARLAGLGARDSLAVGVAMSARGAVELVVLSIAEKAGVFASDGVHPIVANLFSALVVTAVVTTLAMPVLLRRVLPPGPK